MDMSQSNVKPVYRPGQEFMCPQCGMQSVVLEEQLVEGLFEVVGKRYVCSSCGWQIPPELVFAPVSSTSHLSSSSSDDAALEALFGDSTPLESGPILEDDTLRFCKNCRHYLQSPFLSRCLLSNREVDPLGLCQNFSLPADE